MSFLLSEGHASAASYPICTLWEEVRIAQQRVNRQLASEGVVFQTAAAAVMGKKGAKAFKELIERLQNG